MFKAPTDFTYIAPFDPAVYSYEAPHIAVTSSGTAYLAWRRKKLADNSYIDCWNTPVTDTGCMVMQTNPIPVSGGLPRVAARGEAVYAVYEVIAGSGTALFYEQLKPLYRSKGEIPVLDPSIRNTDTDLAVSGDGTLHVVWRNFGPSATVWFKSNYGTTGDMDNHNFMMSPMGNLTPPRIACDEAPDATGKCFFSYGWHNNAIPASVALGIRFFSVNNSLATMNGLDVDLTNHQPWTLRGTPALAAAGSGGNSRAYLAFSATNAQSPTYSQIFNLTYSPNGSSLPVPVQLTTPTGSYLTDKSSPLITPVTGDFEGAPFTSGVTAWRNDSSIPGGFYDAYLWDTAESVRKVFTSYHFPAAGGVSPFDLAGNGTIAGGVWIDEQSSRNTRRVPWVTTNNFPIYLPVLLR